MLHCKLKSSGITLIELLVILVILTILMALSVPSYRDYVHKNKLSSLTRQLAEALTVTKQLAIVRGQRHYFNVRVNNTSMSTFESCWVISHSENCDCLTPHGLCQAQYGRVSAAITDIELIINRARLSFSPLFGATNGASYQLTLGRFSTKIIVSTQGRIRICMISGESAIYGAC